MGFGKKKTSSSTDVKGKSNGKEPEKPTYSVGAPVAVKRVVHVDFDTEKGGFKGLPPEWQEFVKSQGLSENEAKADPQAAIDVVNFAMKRMEEQEKKQEETEARETRRMTRVAAKAAQKKPAPKAKGKPGPKKGAAAKPKNSSEEDSDDPKSSDSKQSEAADEQVEFLDIEKPIPLPSSEKVVTLKELISTEDPNDVYEPVKGKKANLGEGAAGAVFLATDRKTGESVAIKKNESRPRKTSN